jgi:thiol:disulfide interchange protein
MKRNSLIFAGLLALVLLLSGQPPAFATQSFGGIGKSKSKVETTLYSRVEAGRVRVVIVIEPASHWHIYHTELGHEDAVGMPTRISMTGEGVEWGELKWPEPYREEQPAWNAFIYSHKGTIVVRGEGVLAEGATGEDVGLTIRGQTCDEELCLQFSETVTTSGRGDDALFPVVEDAAVGATTDDGAPQGGKEQKPEESGPLDGGLMSYLLSAVGWGLFTLLMPCTYPMIPITISFFTKQATDKKSSALPLALAYGLGIVAVFIVIGVAFGSVIIPFATHPITNVILGAMFLYFAFVLFGVINLQPPRFLLEAAGKASSMGGYLGVFLMGTTLVVTSFTCTAPFVGTLLAQGASGGEVWRIALGMGVFGLTMALPFVALSLLPGKMQSIPRSGEWMNTLKVFLGFVELAAALKFISNVDLVWNWNLISREVFLGSWVVIFVLAAIFLFGLLPGKRAKPGAIRVVVGVLVLSLTGYLGWGMNGGQLDKITVSFVPPYSGGVLLPHLSEKEKTYIADDYDGALEAALASNKLLLVNFTGHT